MKLITFLHLLFLSFFTIACDFPDVTFKTDFPTGRLSHCEYLGNSSYLLTLRPENTPINDSPWYAFKVEAKKVKNIKVALVVEEGSHRYPPKISHDGKTWRLQDYRITKDRLVMDISISNTPIWVSAQEIISNRQYIDWGTSWAQKGHVTHNILGWSVQERPIWKLESVGKGKEWLIVLGRQHPPELTGAMALFPFADTLLNESSLAKTFRERFNILIVPNLNPDGVYLGNWRHNANGIDLNRDWKHYNQPEVSSVHNYLSRLTEANQTLAMAVDFHSTHKDVFYTMPENYGVKNPYLVSHWLKALDLEYPDFDVIQKPGNNPGKGVFKQYFSDQYKVHAITYEMGDNTDRVFINEFAESAANQLMRTMLASKHSN